ncbi:TPA: tail fiber assembly protein [Citrobacter farmeri]|nr:tail fiber assembly protein [Citrobacter farmeri]
MITMKNIREGDPKTPEQYELAKQIRARFFYDETGSEWYESQKLFSPDTLKIAYESNGVIRSIQTDISLIYPNNLSVAEVDNTTANRCADTSGWWLYIDGEIVRRQQTSDELIEAADNEKARLMALANAAIAPLQYAAEMNMGTDDEAERLLEWKKYAVLLNRVDPNKAPDIEWPLAPE